MDSLHPRNNSSSSSNRNYQQKNYELIQKMSYQSRKKKEADIERQHCYDAQQKGFQNFISGANAPRPARTQQYAKPQKEWTQYLNIDDQLRQNVYSQQSSSSNRVAYQNTYENTLACVQSVAQDSLRPVKNQNAKTANLLLTGCGNTQNMGGTLEGDTSYVQVEYSPALSNNQVLKSTLNADTSVITAQQQAPSIIFGESIGNSTQFQHPSENYSEEMRSLDRMIYENEKNDEAICLLMGRAADITAYIEGDQEMKMVQLAENANRLSPQFIPESLFNLIDYMDTYMYNADALFSGYENEYESKYSNYDIYESKDSIKEQITILPSQNAKYEHNSIAQPSQRYYNTDFYLYEDDEGVIEQDTMDQRYNAVSVTNHHKVYIDDYQDDFPAELDTMQISQKVKPDYQNSLRNKMTITKEDMQRIMSSNVGEDCVIECNQKENHPQGKPSILDSVYLPGSRLQNRIYQPNQCYSNQNQIQLESSKPHNSANLSNHISQSPETSRRKKRVAKAKQDLPPKPEEQTERAQQLMMSLTSQGIQVDQLTDRLQKMSREQRYIILQVMCQIESGDVAPLKEVKQIVTCYDENLYDELMSTLSKQAQKPPQSAKRVKRMRKVVNKQMENDVE